MWVLQIFPLTLNESFLLDLISENTNLLYIYIIYIGFCRLFPLMFNSKNINLTRLYRL